MEFGCEGEVGGNRPSSSSQGNEQSSLVCGTGSKGRLRAAEGRRRVAQRRWWRSDRHSKHVGTATGLPRWTGGPAGGATGTYKTLCTTYSFVRATYSTTDHYVYPQSARADARDLTCIQMRCGIVVFRDAVRGRLHPLVPRSELPSTWFNLFHGTTEVATRGRWALPGITACTW